MTRFGRLMTLSTLAVVAGFAVQTFGFGHFFRRCGCCSPAYVATPVMSAGCWGCGGCAGGFGCGGYGCGGYGCAGYGCAGYGYTGYGGAGYGAGAWGAGQYGNGYVGGYYGNVGGQYGNGFTGGYVGTTTAGNYGPAWPNGGPFNGGYGMNVASNVPPYYAPMPAQYAPVPPVPVADVTW